MLDHYRKKDKRDPNVVKMRFSLEFLSEVPIKHFPLLLIL